MHDTVWVWSPRCAKPTMLALRVRLDGQAVYTASLPICLWERQYEAGKASFRLTPKRTIVWYGYKTDEGDGTPDPGDPTPAGRALDFELWQAGGEPDAIELGCIVSDAQGLHTHTILAVSPTKRNTSTLAAGLVVETWPEKKP